MLTLGHIFLMCLLIGVSALNTSSRPFTCLPPVFGGQSLAYLQPLWRVFLFLGRSSFTRGEGRSSSIWPKQSPAGLMADRRKSVGYPVHSLGPFRGPRWPK